MKILVGIPTIRYFHFFMESVEKFRRESKHDLTLWWEKDKFLADAQNKIADEFLSKDYDYLLFLDDDHWGHTPEMLECLINANAYVATMKTYSRHYPYGCALIKKVGEGVVMPIEDGEGYREVDLTGFPMTLIRRDLFSKLDKPYFRATEACGRDWNTDIDFFERLEKLGIKPIGCFQHCLNHDKITQENVHEYRFKERKDNNNLAWFNLIRQEARG